MIRCKDIAAIVGVSRQAVTAVLNNSRPNCVSPEKREEILAVAARHHYRPNHAAFALKTGKSNLIGIVMPSWDNPYVAELCMGLQQNLAARNYTPLFTIDNNYNPVPGNLEQLLSLNVGGIISVAASLLPDDIDIPAVSYYYDDPRFDSVCPNFKEQARLVISYLHECGHRKIGYFGSLNDQRIPYWISESERCGLEFRESWRIESVGDDPADAFDRLLKKNCNSELPSALIVYYDALAQRLMCRIRERGFRIPEDFSIISHDNISSDAYSFPALTSVSSGAPGRIADTMIQLLINRIKDPGCPRKKVLLDPELIKRESVLVTAQKTNLREIEK